MQSGVYWLSTQSRRVLMIETMRRLFKTLSVLLALSSEVSAADLPGRVELALRKAGVPNSNVAIVVQEVGASRPELALNVREPMNPASAMKLVTTYAALELLNPSYRWKTEVYS